MFLRNLPKNTRTNEYQIIERHPNFQCLDELPSRTLESRGIKLLALQQNQEQDHGSGKPDLKDSLLGVMEPLGLWREGLEDEIPRSNWERHGDVLLVTGTRFNRNKHLMNQDAYRNIRLQ